MAENTFQCSLVTPAEKLLDEEVTYTSFPAWDGLVGIMPRRAPMLGRLGLGELKIAFPPQNGTSGGERSYLVDGGFVKMADNKLTILAERAIPAEHLTVSEAKAELAEAQARVVPEDAPDAIAQKNAIARDKARAAMKLKLAHAVEKQGI